jgi:hypothetical protein
MVVTAFTVSYTMIFIVLYHRMSDVIDRDKVAMNGAIAAFKDLGYTIGPLLAGTPIEAIGIRTPSLWWEEHSSCCSQLPCFCMIDLDASHDHAHFLSRSRRLRLLERAATVKPSASALDAMNSMAHQNVGRLLALGGPGLLGIVTRGDLMRTIRTRQELVTQ